MPLAHQGARDWFKGELTLALPKARILDPIPLRMYEV